MAMTQQDKFDDVTPTKEEASGSISPDGKRKMVRVSSGHNLSALNVETKNGGDLKHK
jgi:hypothetical protein